MNRNIYRRIEVCFPVYEKALQNELKEIVDLQLRDNVSAVMLDRELENNYIEDDDEKIRSQEEIMNYCVSSHSSKLLMNFDAVIINGVSLPYHVLEKAINHAKAGKSSIRIVFIYQSNWANEDFTSSHDIRLSIPEFTEMNAEENMDKLIHRNVEYAKTQFAQNDVMLETLIMRNPSVESIAKKMRNVQHIFLDPDTFTHPQEFAYVNFQYSELEEKLSSKIRPCRR
jgi:hypothetical protein